MATTINVKNIPEGYQSIISNGTHTIVGDEPLASKGTNLGLSPGELVLSGLAMCKAATVRHIARKNNWDVKDVKAKLTQEVKRGENGTLSTTVFTEIEIEGNISENQKTELLKEADNCYIHRMIEGNWDIKSATAPENRQNENEQVK